MQKNIFFLYSISSQYFLTRQVLGNFIYISYFSFPGNTKKPKSIYYSDIFVGTIFFSFHPDSLPRHVQLFNFIFFFLLILFLPSLIRFLICVPVTFCWNSIKKNMWTRTGYWKVVWHPQTIQRIIIFPFFRVFSFVSF